MPDGTARAMEAFLLGQEPSLTRVQVAERAGVSVGTLYQYYPHKQALLYAVLQRHLARVGEAVAQAARSVHGAPLAVMVSTVVKVFVKAKTINLEEGRALYAVAGELDTRELVLASQRRGRAALAEMLATAADVEFEDVATAAFMLNTAMIGPMQPVIEGNAPAKLVRNLPGQLESLALGYLEREARARESLTGNVG